MRKSSIEPADSVSNIQQENISETKIGTLPKHC